VEIVERTRRLDEESERAPSRTRMSSSSGTANDGRSGSLSAPEWSRRVHRATTIGMPRVRREFFGPLGGAPTAPTTCAKVWSSSEAETVDDVRHVRRLSPKVVGKPGGAVILDVAEGGADARVDGAVQLSPASSWRIGSRTKRRRIPWDRRVKNTFRRDQQPSGTGPSVSGSRRLWIESEM